MFALLVCMHIIFFMTFSTWNAHMPFLRQNVSNVLHKTSTPFRFMLNVDMCSIVDLESITESCCARIRDTQNTPGETFCIDPRHGFGADTTLQTTLAESGVIQQCPTPEDPSHPRHEAWVAAHDFVVTVPNGGNNPDADRNEIFYEAFAEAWQKATERGYPEGSLSPLAASCVDHCASNDCVNGQCSNGADTYECVCDQGWTGTLCDENINECDPNPCINGSCEDDINSYTCTCAPGFDGDNCENDINECDPSPCINGSCTDGENSFTCSCNEGWMGILCDEVVPDCVDVETLLDGQGRERDCAWVLQLRRNGTNRCSLYAHLCPVSCGECDCLLENRVCSDNGDCCTGFCDGGFCSCKRRGESCTDSNECCNDNACRGDDTCGPNLFSF